MYKLETGNTGDEDETTFSWKELLVERSGYIRLPVSSLYTDHDLTYKVYNIPYM